MNIIKVPKVTQESEDDILTVSSSSYEEFFSSSDSSEEEEEEEEVEESANTKSIQGNEDTFTRKKNNDSKDYDEDEKLNKIITKIEREHISTMYDNHLNTKNDKKKVSRTLSPNIKIKKEDDHSIEIAFSVRTIQECQTNGKEPNQCIS